MILVSASSTARTTARHSGSENPSFAASSPKAFRTTHSIAGSLRNSILSSKLPRLTRALSSGQRNRILCRTQTGNRLACAAIIPLVPVSLPGSSSLPEGSHSRWLAPPQKERVHFHERSLIEPGRLSPPIWPCTTRGFPCPRCHHRSGGLLPHLFTLAKRREHVEAGL